MPRKGIFWNKYFVESKKSRKQTPPPKPPKKFSWLTELSGFNHFLGSYVHYLKFTFFNIWLIVSWIWLIKINCNMRFTFLGTNYYGIIKATHSRLLEDFLAHIHGNVWSGHSYKSCIWQAEQIHFEYRIEVLQSLGCKSHWLEPNVSAKMWYLLHLSRDKNPFNCLVRKSIW